MKLPFVDKKKFERLPGETVSCYGLFKRNEIETLLEEHEEKVLATVARFLQVQNVEIIQVIPMSTNVVGIFFGEKIPDLYEWDDED